MAKVLDCETVVSSNSSCTITLIFEQIPQESYEPTEQSFQMLSLLKIEFVIHEQILNQADCTLLRANELRKAMDPPLLLSRADWILWP